MIYFTFNVPELAVPQAIKNSVRMHLYILYKDVSPKGVKYSIWAENWKMSFKILNNVILFSVLKTIVVVYQIFLLV